jgi:transposase-like protein
MVGVCQRADVDWPAVELAWRAGESFGALARRHGVTRQSIAKRCAKAGWQRAEAAEAIAASSTARRLANPITGTDVRMVRDGRRSAANMLRILDMLATGATVPMAARRVGLSPDALHDWLKADPEFNAAVAGAQADFGARLVETIDKAGERDWRAHAHLLERHPATRAEFAPAVSGTPAGPPVVLALHISADLAATLAAPPAPAGHVIEHDEED